MSRALAPSAMRRPSSGRRLEELGAQIQKMEHFHQQLTGYRKQCDEALAEGECCPVIVSVAQSSALEPEKK